MKRIISILLCITIIFSITYIASFSASAEDEDITITVDDASQNGVALIKTQITDAVHDMISRFDNNLTVYVNGAVFDYILNSPQYQSSNGIPDKEKIAEALIDINHENFRTSSEIAYQALYIEQYGYGYSYSTIYRDNKYHLSGYFTINIEYQYYETKQGFSEVQNYVDNNIDTVLGDALTQYEKVKKIHDFVAKSFSYDQNANQPGAMPGLDFAYSGSDMIKKGKGVCAGYSALAYMFLKKANIESKIVATDDTYGVNPGKDPESHAWSLVKIDEKWYHMDVTWASVGNGNVRYNFFLLSNTSFENVYIGSNLYQHLWKSALYPEALIDYSDHADTLIAECISEIAGLPENITQDHLEQVSAIRLKIRSIPVEDWDKITNLDVLIDAENKLGLSENKLTSDKYQIDEQNNIITKVHENTDINNFLSGFSGGTLQIVKENGDQVTSGKIGTGMILVHSINSVEQGRFTVMILGDVDGDGSITAKDMLLSRRKILQISSLEGIFSTAADVDKDSNITAKDVLRMQRNILQIEQIEQ